ncbi:MAG TPA: hypothetical protein VNA20_00790 [Frankiaceae bacterium]|nr:hypothetical protein [Frankiaceae bacterium]
MSTTAVQRAFAALLATLLAVVAYHAVTAQRAEAVVRPSRPADVAPVADEATRPVLGSGVKYVRNADGSVTRTR